MVTVKEIVGCAYDEKGKLTHIVHFEKGIRRPIIYGVDHLGLDEVVELLNSEKEK